jgi:hypothetical protein
MQNASESVGIVSDSSKTMARLPSHLNSFGNNVLNVPTSVYVGLLATQAWSGMP